MGRWLKSERAPEEKGKGARYPPFSRSANSMEESAGWAGCVEINSNEVPRNERYCGIREVSASAISHTQVVRVYQQQRQKEERGQPRRLAVLFSKNPWVAQHGSQWKAGGSHCIAVIVRIADAYGT